MTLDKRLHMGFTTKVQCIKRKKSRQWYINFPSAFAQAMDFTQSEEVEWVLGERGKIELVRRKPGAGSEKNTAGRPRARRRAAARKRRSRR